jgi:hypothetical protein
MKPLSLLAALQLAGLLGVSRVEAAPRMTVVVGKIASEKSCKVYQEWGGRSAFVATPYVLAAASSWRTWLVKDCVDNFNTIRTSVEAALASSGKFSVKTSGGGAYTVSGAISQVGGGDGGPVPDVPTASNAFSTASTQMFVSIDVTVRNSAGRIVYGGLLTKHIETGSNIKTPGLETSSSQSGEALYTVLQHEVALAVARVVAFHIDPLRVVSTDEKEIHLNYGSPLLTLGTIVHVTSPDSGTVRYAITASSPEGATAEVDGERGDWAKVVPGSLVNVIESDDPTANERRMKKVDLPE